MAYFNSPNFLRVEAIKICLKKGLFYSHSMVELGLGDMS